MQAVSILGRFQEVYARALSGLRTMILRGGCITFIRFTLMDVTTTDVTGT